MNYSSFKITIHKASSVSKHWLLKSLSNSFGSSPLVQCYFQGTAVTGSTSLKFTLLIKKSGIETSLSLIFPQLREASVQMIAIDYHLNQLIN